MGEITDKAGRRVIREAVSVSTGVRPACNALSWARVSPEAAMPHRGDGFEL